MNPTRVPLKTIRSFYESGYSFPLILERKAPCTPWELYQRVYSESPTSFLLDSLECEPLGRRYSYLGWKPYLKVFLKAHTLEIEGVSKSIRENRDLHSELRSLFKEIRVAPGFSCDFFTGGAVGCWGYELAEEFEKISFRPKEGPHFPKLALLFLKELIVFDHREESFYLVSWLVPEKGVSFEDALARSDSKIGEMDKQLFIRNGLHGAEDFELIQFHPEISRDSFKKMVRKAKDYIAAGDIYQANLSQRFSFRFSGSPLALYGELRQTNPSPYAAFLRLDDLLIASSSPELLVEKKGRRCVTCPIAGTRPRGRGRAEARRFERELLASEKERAEHLMLVDLERNDLGRVSEWRSVRVKDFMRIEKYARVIHIVSEITSCLAPSRDAWDLIQAMFPGGTITGCPKIRSMEIIDELEPVERGAYTGSIGYVGFDGNAMLNIAIRTFVLLREQGYLQVGAGIVADSDPDLEYEETLAKGEALAEALVGASL